MDPVSSCAGQDVEPNFCLSQGLSIRGKCFRVACWEFVAFLTDVLLLLRSAQPGHRRTVGPSILVQHSVCLHTGSKQQGVQSLPAGASVQLDAGSECIDSCRLNRVTASHNLEHWHLLVFNGAGFAPLHKNRCADSAAAWPYHLLHLSRSLMTICKFWQSVSDELSASTGASWDC